MKLTHTLTAILVSLSIAALPVFATANSPSPEKDSPVQMYVTKDEDGNKTIGSIYDENDTFERSIHEDELILTTLWHLESGEIEVHNKIEETLVNARDELKDADLGELVDGFKEHWEEITGGAPVEHAVISDIFDVRYNSVVDGFLTKLLVEGKSATFDIKVDGVTKDTLFVVGHKPSDTNEWVLEDYTVSDDGVITISVDSLSPFFIAVDNGQAPDDDGAPDSPQTGVDEDFALPFTFAGVLAIVFGFAYLCNKKIRKVTDK